MTVADLATDSYQSQTRNKLVAEAFYLTKNIEKYGSGFIRIRKELETYPEVSFKVEEVGGGVLVTFALRSSDSEGVNEGVSDGVNGGVSGGVSGGVNDVLDFISRHPGTRSAEIKNKLNISQRTIERWLKQLRDENRIEFKGSPKAGGYYVV